METRDIITLVGWPVSCLLSILAGGFFIPRFTKKTKILSWAVISENELISSELQDSLSVPVKIEVDGHPLTSLSSVSITLQNSGNEVIENQLAVLSVPKETEILHAKFSGISTEYEKHLSLEIKDEMIELHFGYLNPKSPVELEILFSNYQEATVSLDAAGPGLSTVRSEMALWNASAAEVAIEALGLVVASQPLGRAILVIPALSRMLRLPTRSTPTRGAGKKPR